MRFSPNPYLDLNLAGNTSRVITPADNLDWTRGRGSEGTLEQARNCRCKAGPFLAAAAPFRGIVKEARGEERRVDRQDGRMLDLEDIGKRFLSAAVFPVT